MWSGGNLGYVQCVSHRDIGGLYIAGRRGLGFWGIEASCAGTGLPTLYRLLLGLTCGLRRRLCDGKACIEATGRNTPT